FSEPGPGLSQFDQVLVGLVGGLVRQAQAFGSAPLMILESGHGALRCATQKPVDRFLTIMHRNVDKSVAGVPALLFTIRWSAYRYRVPAGFEALKSPPACMVACLRRAGRRPQ